MSFADSMESLKNFDVNDLDFNNAGSWPGPIKVIAFVIVAVLILGGGYWFLVKDQYSDLDRVAKKEVQLREQYEAKAFEVANLDAFRAKMAAMEETFGALLKQLPADTEVPGLLEDITNTGLGSGLEIESIKLKPEVSQEFYVELPIDISVTGTYHDLGAFVSGVASLPRIVTLHDFSIARSDGSSEDLDGFTGDFLTMSISAKTYRYNPDQNKKSGKKKAKGKR